MTELAVLICQGCDIASALDVTALEQLAKQQPGVTQVKSLPCLCNADGQAAICAAAGGANGPTSTVLAACSARFMPFATCGVTLPLERVALRELVVNSHMADSREDAQSLAEDYLRMGLIRATKSRQPEAEGLAVERRVLVVGAGPTGIAAALTAARAGYEVVLIEKEAELGGWLRSTTRLLPSRAPYREVEGNPLADLLREIDEEPSIAVYRKTTSHRIVGQPGHFAVELHRDGESIQVTVGAIVQATGWLPYDAARLSHLGYGKSPDVVTSVEFEQMLNTKKLCRASDGKPAHRIAFVQCAGSRDTAHLPYCSGVCCRVTLKQAIFARELDSEAEIYVLSKDMRALGLHENFYRRAQEDPSIFFTKGEATDVALDENGSISVEVADGLLGPSVAIEADLVVLAVGMVPRASNNDVLRELGDARAALVRDGQAEAVKAASEATIIRLDALSDTGTLGLGYRQGPDLPLDRYGFPDSHFICFPYETRRTGIYAAGAVRAPNDIPTCRVDGEGATLKAIQSIEHAAEGTAMHPRWGDAGLPNFALQRCTQCKRCTEECPFGTLDEDERCTPKLHPGRCRRCGICLGACPERIISFPEYSIDIVSSLIKSVPIPDEFEESPRILVLACENDAYPALELAGFHRHGHSPYVRVIPVRCLGSVNVVWIADAMAMGYDGVLLLGCKPGEDTQCHFLRGSDLMTTRGENVKQKLKQLALEDERVRIEYVTIADHAAISARINAFVGRIQELGLNPFKDV
jgi:quinone-modifying oxidoreductase, subunit QmoB